MSAGSHGQQQQQQLSPTQSRQAGPYPPQSPHSYPSPQMSAYNYPPPGQQQSADPYASTPSSSQAAVPSLSLPPIRSVPTGPNVGHQQGTQSMPSPLAPAVSQMSGYYPGQGLPLPQHPGMIPGPVHHAGIPYSQPSPEGRSMSGGRQKKEIKRRTKTGCLTCRKRRIKCDEAHPVCRNCTKSKRECLGYDPIFKPASQSAGSAQSYDHAQGVQQSHPGNIMPMSGGDMPSPTLGPSIVAQLREAAGNPVPQMPLNSGMHSHSAYAAQGMSSAPTATASMASPYSTGLYAPSTIGQPPYAISGIGGPGLSADPPSPSVSSMVENYDFPAIDPSLEAAVPGSSVTATSSAPLKRTFDEREGSDGPNASEKDAVPKAKRIKIDDLLSISAQKSPLSERFPPSIPEGQGPSISSPHQEQQGTDSGLPLSVSPNEPPLTPPGSDHSSTTPSKVSTVKNSLSPTMVTATSAASGVLSVAPERASSEPRSQ